MASQAGADHRASPRAAVALAVRLDRKVGRTVSAQTVDIGAGGARVMSERPLRLDEELRIDVELMPDRPHVGGTARVLRQDRHNVYALRFERITPESLVELQTFLDQHTRAPLL